MDQIEYQARRDLLADDLQEFVEMYERNLLTHKDIDGYFAKYEDSGMKNAVKEFKKSADVYCFLDMALDELNG